MVVSNVITTKKECTHTRAYILIIGILFRNYYSATGATGSASSRRSLRLMVR